MKKEDLYQYRHNNNLNKEDKHKYNRIAYELINNEELFNYLLNIQYARFNKYTISSEFEAMQEGIKRVLFDRFFDIIRTDAQEYIEYITQESDNKDGFSAI